MIESWRYTFRCSICRKFYSYDRPDTPLCTGPGPADEHEMVAMDKYSAERVDDADVLLPVSSLRYQ